MIRKEKRTQGKRTTKGITLIALVVTIVVILILAGVTISTLFGENGIINYANKAKDEAQRSAYQDVLDTLEAGLQLQRIQENLSKEEYLNKFKDAIKKEPIFDGSTITDQGEDGFLVETPDHFIFKVTDEDVTYVGKSGDEGLETPPDIENSKITFEHDPKGWTNNKIKVSISTELTQFKIQYALSKPEENSSWKPYTESVEFEGNGFLYARLVNNLGQSGNGGCATHEVTEIDKTLPQGTDGITIKSKTESQITPSLVATDEGGSGIAKVEWSYSIANKNNWQSVGENSYQTENKITAGKPSETAEITIENLEPATTYDIKAVIWDVAGNKAEITTIDGIKTKDIEVTNVTVMPTEATIKVDEQVKLTASIEPTNATNQKLTWKADPSDAVSIETSEDGKQATITGVKGGTVRITVTTNDDSTITAKCSILIIEDWGGDIGVAIDVDDYGKKVKNYSVGVNEWSLFYKNKDYTYIISDTLVVDDRVNRESYDSSIMVAGGLAARLSPRISDIRDGSNSRWNFYPNYWGFNFLLNPANWVTYRSDEALYAIGSPTLELFAASYNTAGFVNTIKVSSLANYPNASNVRAAASDSENPKYSLFFMNSPYSLSSPSGEQRRERESPLSLWCLKCFGGGYRWVVHYRR